MFVLGCFFAISVPPIIPFNVDPSTHAEILERFVREAAILAFPKDKFKARQLWVTEDTRELIINRNQNLALYKHAGTNIKRFMMDTFLQIWKMFKSGGVFRLRNASNTPKGSLQCELYHLNKSGNSTIIRWSCNWGFGNMARATDRLFAHNMYHQANKWSNSMLQLEQLVYLDKQTTALEGALMSGDPTDTHKAINTTHLQNSQEEHNSCATMKECSPQIFMNTK